MNTIGVGLSLERASIIPGKNDTIDKNPTINGASILITVNSWKKNHAIALTIVTRNPKKINKLKL